MNSTSKTASLNFPLKQKLKKRSDKKREKILVKNMADLLLGKKEIDDELHRES